MTGVIIIRHLCEIARQRDEEVKKQREATSLKIKAEVRMTLL